MEGAGIPRKWGVSRANFFKKGVGRFKPKNFPWEGCGYFLEQHKIQWNPGTLLIGAPIGQPTPDQINRE